MNKKDLMNSLARVLSTKKEAKDAIETVFFEMRKALRDGEKIVISGFGSFNAFVARAKKGRNPRTGETVNVAPRKKVRFKQSKEMF